MIKLQGERLYLAALSKEDCIKLRTDVEYDFENITKPLGIGLDGTRNGERVYENLQSDFEFYRDFGIYLNSGELIGDIALQYISWIDRTADVGAVIAKLCHRSKGYMKEANRLLISYAFNNIGLERLSSETLEPNVGAQKSLEACGFVLEGRERKAVYFAGRRWDKLHYGILREEYNILLS